MPLRSPKMKRRIFGFQRRVWWPKWTPASSSCFMVTTATGLSLGYDFRPLRPSSDGATLGCGRANSRTGARVTISVGGRPSRQPFGLDPIGPGEPHGEDEAAAAQADPHREAGWIDTPDDPARDPVEDHDLAA